MSNIFLSDIECYYLTKNVLMKIQQNKYFNNLYKCAETPRKKNLTAFGTGFNISILEYLGTIYILEAGPPVLNTRRGQGKLKSPCIKYISQRANPKFQQVCLPISDT